MKFSIITLGCKVNSCESAAIEAAFIAAGYSRCGAGECADIYIINSCAVTGAGVKKARQCVSRCKAENPRCVTVLCGCYPQAYPDEAALSVPAADIITGNADKAAIPSLVSQYLADRRRVMRVGRLSREFDRSSAAPDLDRTRAFIKIEDGCNRFCAYCVIPYARGRVRSLPPQEITRQAEAAAAAGNREIVLTGINIGCYGEDIGYTPAAAVAAAEVAGIERIRLGSLEADTLTGAEIDRLGRCERLCPHFHLSLQSGSDTVLRRMNRRYTAGEYYALVERLRGVFRGCSITTDIMVGFPGETDEEFSESMAFAEKIGFAKLHVFPYSVRPGTAAEKMSGQIPPEIKAQRAKLMGKLADELSRKFLSAQVGAVQRVLIEKSTSPDFSHGFTPNYIPVRIYGEDIPRHTLIDVEIISAGDGFCIGKALN